MTDLRSELGRYLGMRQGLGYKYQHPAQRLADFVSFNDCDLLRPAPTFEMAVGRLPETGPDLCS